MNLSKLTVLITVITLGFTTSDMSKGGQVACNAYPYPEGITVKVNDSEAIYIYTVAVGNDVLALNNYSSRKLRASRIAIEKLGKYIFNKYNNKLDFGSNTIGGIFLISECISYSDKKLYASYAWNKASHEVSNIIKQSIKGDG